MDDFRAIYDISRGSYQWLFPGVGILFVLLSICLISIAKIYYKDKKNAIIDLSSKQRLFFNLNHPINKNAFIRFPRFVFVFALLFTITSFLSTFSIYNKFSKIYKENRYSILKGKVERLKFKGENKKIDVFVVGGKEFVYSNYNINNSFKGIGSYEGMINEGIIVKIYYFDNNILRLEIIE